MSKSKKNVIFLYLESILVQDMENIFFRNDNYTIHRIENVDLRQLAEFVVSENCRHHCADESVVSEDVDCIKAICQEEKSFANSYIYIAYNNLGKIIGSIRTFKWDKNSLLPMEKIFGINPIDAVPHGKDYDFWHIGRFAIDSYSGISTLTLFKQLVYLSIMPIIEDPKGCMIAEMDSKLLRTLNILGIETVRLGKSVEYLHSETIPVYSERKGLLYFYNRNSDILKK